MHATDLLIPSRAYPPSLEPGDHEDWPYDALQAFILRMGRHGVPVSSRLMAGNRVYALQQLACARALEDESLAEMAWALFRHFERQRSGLVETD
ncbi:MAG: hypothetical protein EOO24_38920 [Comamonadaceae bacterium]|nr:MAG: hypothetical protein EOO24_38920 [Comamonadaceae bacterium]